MTLGSCAARCRSPKPQTPKQSTPGNGCRVEPTKYTYRSSTVDRRSGPRGLGFRVALLTRLPYKLQGLRFGFLGGLQNTHPKGSKNPNNRALGPKYHECYIVFGP